jgi:hypothetical protein
MLSPKVPVASTFDNRKRLGLSVCQCASFYQNGCLLKGIVMIIWKIKIDR